MIKTSWMAAFLFLGVLASAGGAAAESVNLGSALVGGSSITAVTIAIPRPAGTMTAAIFTSGYRFGDFEDAGGGTCTIAGAGAPCTVNVAFRPQFAGVRLGAIVLTDFKGIVTTVYLEGIGLGPQPGFTPGTLTTVASGLQQARGIAVDGAGNVYFGSGANVMTATLSSGTYTVSTIPTTGLESVSKILIDGAGNLYVLDASAGSVVELSPLASGGYTQQTVVTGLSNLGGGAVDGAGNLYLAMGNLNNGWRALRETPGATGFTQSTLTLPENVISTEMAVDGDGNLYFALQPDGGVFKYISSAGQFVRETIGASPEYAPVNMTADMNGNIFLVDYSLKQILKLTDTAGTYVSSVLATGLNDSCGLTIDQSGNVYCILSPDTGSQSIVKFDFTVPPALDFGTVPVGTPASATTQTVTVQNTGTAPMIFPIPDSGDNPSLAVDFPFAYNASTSCARVSSASVEPATLWPGEICQLPISFTPTAIGPLSETIELTDNALYTHGYATQTVNLTGIATKGPQTIKFTGFPAQYSYGSGPITLVVKDGASGNPVLFTVTGPGTLTGNKLKITGAGKLTVTANQAGNDQYLAGTATASVNIAKAWLWVYAENASRAYGKPNPALTYSIVGMVKGDTSAQAYTGAPKLTTTATATSLPGSYPITTKIGTLTAKNYKFMLNNAALTVTPLGVAATPNFSPKAGTYKAAQTVTISSTTAGAVIYYTVNGTAPTASSTRYTKPIAVAKTETVKALAVAKGYTNSAVATAKYTIN